LSAQNTPYCHRHIINATCSHQQAHYFKLCSAAKPPTALTHPREAHSKYVVGSDSCIYPFSVSCTKRSRSRHHHSYRCWFVNGERNWRSSELSEI
jgi:hypothetical protein